MIYNIMQIIGVLLLLLSPARTDVMGTNWATTVLGFSFGLLPIKVTAKLPV